MAEHIDRAQCIVHRGNRLHTSYEWTHNMGDIINALISSGLRIEFVHEFALCSWRRFPFMEQDEAGWWRIKGDKIPLTFTLRVVKPR